MTLASVGWFRGWMAALIVIGLAAGLFLSRIDIAHMRDDEEIAMRITGRDDLVFVVRYQAFSDVHAPAWFASFWLWQQLVGKSEPTARVFGIFLSMITLSLIYQMGRRWFRNDWTGLIAAAILGVNAYFTLYTLEIRPYALILLTAAISMWTFDRWLRRGTLRSAWVYGLSVALLLYVHYFLLFLVAAQVLFAVIAIRPWRAVGRGLLIVTGTILLFWGLWLPIFVNQIMVLRQVEGAAQRGAAGIASTTEPTTLNAVARLLALASNGLPLLFAAALVFGAFVLWRRRSFWLAAAWALGVPAIALTANFFVAVYTPRYISYLVLGVALLAAAGLSNLPRRVRGAAAVAFCMLSLWSLPSQWPDRIPYRDLFRSVSAQVQPEDVIFFDHTTVQTDNLIRWHIGRYLDRDLWNRRVDSLDAALASPRVWYVTQEWFNEDVRATFNALESTHPLQQVLGKCDVNWCFLIQLMAAPS